MRLPGGGKVWVGILGLIVPAALLGITIVFFSMNPLSVLGCMGWMVGGGMYLMTYTDAEAV